MSFCLRHLLICQKCSFSPQIRSYQQCFCLISSYLKCRLGHNLLCSAKPIYCSSYYAQDCCASIVQSYSCSHRLLFSKVTFTSCFWHSHQYDSSCFCGSSQFCCLPGRFQVAKLGLDSYSRIQSLLSATLWFNSVYLVAFVLDFRSSKLFRLAWCKQVSQWCWLSQLLCENYSGYPLNSSL